MKQVNLSEDKSTVELGMGLVCASSPGYFYDTTNRFRCSRSQTWADAYQELSNEGVNVVGGRVSGPGVGGLTLGGGYSWYV